MAVHAVFAEHDSEPVKGIPGLLPAGEQVLWQGAPAWRSLFWHAYHGRILLVYFAIMVLARGAYLYANDASLLESLRGCVGPGLFALVALAILGALAALAAHRTVYTVTTRRVLIRQGIALESTVNLPFAQLEGASLKRHADGTGDIALRLLPTQRISYLWLWPHVRPGRITRPEPALRAVTDVERGAEVLSRAFASTTSVETSVLEVAPDGVTA